MERTIQLVQPTKLAERKLLRVAAYARVSCDKDAMKHSLAAQISYYNEYIQHNPDWVFAGIYADEAYQYVDGRMRDMEAELCAQKVINQRTQDSFALAQADLAAVKAELKSDIKLEAERRCCGDNSIETYMNATFYPKMVADVTTGTAVTAQSTYNPIPNCGSCCKGN